MRSIPRRALTRDSADLLSRAMTSGVWRTRRAWILAEVLCGSRDRCRPRSAPRRRSTTSGRDTGTDVVGVVAEVTGTAVTGTRAAGIVGTVGTSTVPTGMEAADVEAADVVFAPGADAVGMGTRDVVNGVTASVGSTVDALIGGLSLCRRWSRTPCTMPGPKAVTPSFLATSAATGMKLWREVSLCSDRELRRSIRLAPGRGRRRCCRDNDRSNCRTNRHT